MKNLEFYRGKTVLILGYGISGKGAARLASAYGMKPVPVDVKNPPAESPEMPNRSCFNWKEGMLLPESELAVTSPGIRLDSKMVRAAEKAGAEIVGELEFASRAFPGKIVAVTGTNGKTTTTELSTALFKAAGLSAESAGNIGTALSDAVREKNLDYLIVECSSFQLESIKDFSPVSAAFLNLASDHINRHGSLEKYAESKKNLFRNMDETTHMILNADLPDFCLEGLPSTPGKITFSGTLPADFALTDGFLCFHGKKILDRGELRLEGLHNVENVLASLALLRSCAGDEAIFSDTVKAALRSFRPDAHRMEFFLEKNGVRYVDDSKATNPHSVNAFLRTHGGRKNVVLMLGGLDKGMDFSSIREDAEKIKYVCCFGECREKIRDCLHDVIPCSVCSGTFEEAVRDALKHAAPGDIVAMCPACASMDMFRDYAERGDFFRKFCLAMAT